MQKHRVISTLIERPLHERIYQKQAKRQWLPWQLQSNPEMMNRTEDLTRVGRCKVCTAEFAPGGHYDRERLLQVGICEKCDFWLEKWKNRSNPDVCIAGGHYYVVGDASDRPKGMNGAGVKIKFFDGREVFTDSLWSNGGIPADWLPWLFDNATMEFVK